MDPDTDDTGLYGGQAQQQDQGPPVFTQADSLRLQRLQQGLSSAQDQVDSGELHPDDAAQFTNDINARIAPLMQRQQAAQAYQQSQQVQQLQQGQALQEAMAHEGASFRMDGFADKVATHTDPLSGATGYFYEKEPGKVEQMDPAKFIPMGGLQEWAANQANAGEPGQGGQAGPLVNTAGMMLAGQALNADQGSPWSQGTSQSSWGPPAAGTGASTPAPAPTPGQPQVQPAPDGGHVMTIINGQNQERWHFAPDGKTTLIDSLGPQADAARQQQQTAGLVNPHELAALHQQAQQSFPLPQRSQFAPGRSGDVAFGRAYNATLAHQSSFVNNGARMLGQQRISQGNQQATAQRQQTHEQAARDLETQREQARKDMLDARQHQERTEQQLSVSYRHHLGEVRKEIKDGADIKDPETEAWKRVDNETKGLRERVNPETRTAKGPLGEAGAAAGGRIGDILGGASHEAPAAKDHSSLTGIPDAKKAASAAPAPKPGLRPYTGGLPDVPEALRRRFNP